MKALALVLAMFAAAGPSHSYFVNPFDTYMNSVANRQPGQELTASARACGVPVVGVPSTYELKGEQVPNLTKAVEALETNHFWASQVWKKGARNFVVAWVYDLQQEYRISYCFNENGLLEFEDVRAWIFELPSGKGWSHLQHWTRNASGQLVASPENFLSMGGTPVPRPTLDEDELKSLRYHQDIKSLDDLRLPASMLR